MGQTILVTGGAGFIGSNLVRYLIEHRHDDHIINLDALTYAGNLESLADLFHHPRHEFLHADINDRAVLDRLFPRVDAVLHLAAESHVDRSISDPALFVRTNVLGTQTLLDRLLAHRDRVRCFVFVSTDEVYGQLPLRPASLRFNEDSPLNPTSPYAASKAAADMLASAYHKTYDLDIRITRCTNNLGPYQHPEKLIPRFITRLLAGKPVPLYADGSHVRDWLHVLDHCAALCRVLDAGQPGRVYNIGAENQRSNLELTRMLIELCGRDATAIEHVPDRPGHDLRYAVDPSRIHDELGWTPTRSAWPQALEDTVRWYRDHRRWVERVAARAANQSPQR